MLQFNYLTKNDKFLRYIDADIFGISAENYFKVSNDLYMNYGPGKYSFYIYPNNFYLKPGSEITAEIVDSDENSISINLSDDLYFSPAFRLGFKLDPIENSSGATLLTLAGTSSENKIIKYQKTFYYRSDYINADQLRLYDNNSMSIAFSLEEIDYDNYVFNCKATLSDVSASVLSGYMDGVRIFEVPITYSKEWERMNQMVYHRFSDVSTNINNEAEVFYFNMPFTGLEMQYSYHFKTAFYNVLNEPARDNDGSVFYLDSTFKIGITPESFLNYYEPFNTQITVNNVGEQFEISWDNTTQSDSTYNEFRNMWGEWIRLSEDELEKESYLYIFGFRNSGSVPYHGDYEDPNYPFELFAPFPSRNSLLGTSVLNSQKQNMYRDDTALSYGTWKIFPKKILNVEEFTASFSDVERLFSAYSDKLDSYTFFVISSGSSYT